MWKVTTTDAANNELSTNDPTNLAPGAADPAQGATIGGGGNRNDGVHHTRISGAWVAVAVAVVLGIALVDFIVQNTRSVRIEFFGASGQMPVAVALLGAALAGAVIVLTVGVARMTQLRMANRRGKKLQQQTEALVDGSQP
jgi:uncharacterized integral membrane protein